jgi:hypothetical protein
MRLTIAICLTALAMFCYIAPALAVEPAGVPMLSFQGFTGILNTPSAHVNSEGSIHLLYTDQREWMWRNDRQNYQDNYLMSVGLFNFIELGGRLTEAPGRGRDLSASLKVTSAPLTKDTPLWPVVAFGLQDVGGGSNLQQSKYFVVSEDYWRFRFSAGYGFDSQRMQGVFGGVEFRAHDWVTLLGEYDTRDTSVGIRLVTPEIWVTPVQLTATFKSVLNHEPGNIDIAAGLTFPLDFRKRSGRAADISAPVQSVAAHGMKESTALTSAPTSALTSPPPAAAPPAVSKPAAAELTAAGTMTNAVSAAALENLHTIQKQLESVGFINVRAGQRLTHELVVEYENTIFNHNELDALGVVAGIVAESSSESFETVRIVIKRKDIRVAAIKVPLTTLRMFMKQAGDVRALKESLSFSYDTDFTDDTYYLPQEESGFAFPNTSLILAPGLLTFVGTEVGVFDYLLTFQPEILSTLWKGGVMQLRWEIPLAWSSNFDDGQPFRRFRNDPRMSRAMLFQGINLAPGLMANLGGGMVLYKNYGTLNEVMWSPGEGTHRFRGVQAWSRDTENNNRTQQVYLASYRYLYAPLDLSLEATGGRYWGQDEGFSLELKRFFGDTAVSAYYKNTTTEAGRHWQAAGIQFAFPLTPRKDFKIGPLQVRGTDEFAYNLESTLATGNQRTNDVISQALAINPQPTPALYRSYYNRDRLSAGYLEQHLDRLREAWLLYGQIVSH